MPLSGQLIVSVVLFLQVCFFEAALSFEETSATKVKFLGFLVQPPFYDLERHYGLTGLIQVSISDDQRSFNWTIQDKDCNDSADKVDAIKFYNENSLTSFKYELLQFEVPKSFLNELADDQQLYLCSKERHPTETLAFRIWPASHQEHGLSGLSRREARAVTEESASVPEKRPLPRLEDAEEEAEIHHTHQTQEAGIVAIQLQEITKYASYSDEGIITALQGSELNLHVYGFGLTNDAEIKLSSFPSTPGHICKSDILHVQTRSFPISASPDGTSGNVTIPAGTLPILDGEEVMYVCLKSGRTGYFLHQGTLKSLQIEVYELLLPVWLMIVFLLILLSMSGLFSGLNLGLMALDQTELKIVQNTGSERERRYANTILPVRAHGNFLLCTLLLGNVLVNNTLTILLDSLTSGIVAVIGATLAIVVMGEIVPQAICSRHGLAVGAHTIWLTKFFMVLTFPLAFPISKILDKILGEEMGTVYNKKRLIELLKVTHETNDLEKEEVDIVTGALIYKEKKVCDVMTPLSDCFLLNIKTVLNFETMAEIKEQGYSRIPVYEGHRSNIIYVLFVKDLMFIDPDDNMPLATVCEFYKNAVNFVFQDTTLNVMLNEFKSGDKGHMAFVQDVVSTEDGDPIYETIGLVTLEDIIEEIIQQEIVDESDVITDNKTKRRRKRKSRKPQESQLPQFLTEPSRNSISPQALLAVFQYLTTSIEPFKSRYMSDVVLRKLLTMDVFVEVKVRKDDDDHPDRHWSSEDFIIQKGKSIDFFMLIVEGRVEANVGREELLFESGPFTYFGLQVLTQLVDGSRSPAPEHVSLASPTAADGAIGSALKSPGGTYVPDYSVRPISDVIYLKIDRLTYLRAQKTSIMKRPAHDHGDEDLEQLLNEEPEVSVGPTRNISSPVRMEGREFSLQNLQQQQQHNGSNNERTKMEDVPRNFSSLNGGEFTKSESNLDDSTFSKESLSKSKL